MASNFKCARCTAAAPAAHDRIKFDDDFNSVHSREARIDQHGHGIATQPKPMHGITGWTLGSAWTLEENHEMALDADGQAYNDEMNVEVFESSIFRGEPADAEKSKKRSKPPNAAVPRLYVIRWADNHFVPTTLKATGLCVQLNHLSFRCPNPIPCHSKLRVLHTTGIHDVAIDYCGCERQIPQYKQFLRCGWYPASQKVVQTCATFPLLEMLHLLSLVSKTSTYHFYRTLEKMTDNTGLDTPPSRRTALMRMLIQWWHLKLLKRGGRAHDVKGPEGTQPGDLAVLCPSCPRPDANFRLKNQMVSSYSRDPGLGIGWAYLTAREPYEAYVRTRATDADISTCVEFSAMKKSNTKFSKGLRYTGVVAVSCGRSEMVLPTCVGNMSKGERYANVDPLAAAAIQQFSNLLWVVISYDIACQWIKTIFTCMTSHWPANLRFNPDIRITPVVPKFHEPGHKQEGHKQFSFNLVFGVRLSDGECPERIWAAHNALGNSTKTAGPGTRQDLIDDHLGFWNWLKYCEMGRTLWKRYKAAISERNRQDESHKGFTLSLPPDMVTEWEDACTTWEEDKVPKTVFNPSEVQSHDLMEDEVHKELAEEEEARRHNGGRVLHDMSPSAFIKFGFAIEESQFKFEELQAIYMPGLLQFITESEELDYSSSGVLAEGVKLWLPSSVPADRHGQVCDTSLSDMEELLHTAQCHDALNSIRHILRLKMRMVEYKNKNIRGQRDGTRSRAGIDAIHERALAAAVKYRRAREAKLRCASSGDWEQVLRKLEDGDICSYQDPDRLRRGTGRRGMNEDSWEPRVGADAPEQGIELHQDDREKCDGTGQTWHSLSWIWTTAKISLDDGANENNDEVLRSEWCRSCARAHRSREEVLLLQEEMRRTLKFLEWRGTWWRERGGTRDVDEALHKALDAYAAVQTDLQHRLAVAFRDLWSTALDDAHVANEALRDGPDQDKDGDSDGSDDEDVGIWNGEEEQDEDEDNEDEEAIVVL
ncbi:hypothetical protein EV421DRAFT_1887058 [Armillaria borealis]|uniref:CxC2-like cysteine cluster KDZ transposase-associated domain-containing protein n=1 Tax=Armillaria borealis TaxID=47425 RepID=A0AA39K9C6_9AGAR|nr:hypothetical protein EV421DRAFT_1887058 [Armillaria borealis]